MSSKKKGVPNPKNSVPRTLEQKKYLSEINKGKRRTVESIAKQKQTVQITPHIHTDASKQKMRKPKTEQAILNMKKSWITRVRRRSYWITNGTEDQLHDKDLPIPGGWRKGRVNTSTPPSQKGKFWINNGVESKMTTSIPNGWVRGQLRKGNQK